MFAQRLIHHIQEHAEPLAAGLMRKLRQSAACDDLLSLVPDNELRHRAFEIYRHVADWALIKTESEIEERYIGLGARRARQQVPFCQMLYAIQATKEHLWEFLRREGLLEPTELIGELDLLYSLERFFDRAVYFSALGYDGARSQQVVHTLTVHKAG